MIVAELLDRLRADEHAAVDEEGRRAGDAQRGAVVVVRLDQAVVLVRRGARLERGAVEPEIRGALGEVGLCSGRPPPRTRFVWYSQNLPWSSAQCTACDAGIAIWWNGSG